MAWSDCGNYVKYTLGIEMVFYTDHTIYDENLTSGKCYTIIFREYNYSYDLVIGVISDRGEMLHVLASYFLDKNEYNQVIMKKRERVINFIIKVDV